MKLSSLHVLLTYQCNYECDHCFVWGSPRQALRHEFPTLLAPNQMYGVPEN